MRNLSILIIVFTIFFFQLSYCKAEVIEALPTSSRSGFGSWGIEPYIGQIIEMPKNTKCINKVTAYLGRSADPDEFTFKYYLVSFDIDNMKVIEIIDESEIINLLFVGDPSRGIDEYQADFNCVELEENMNYAFIIKVFSGGGTYIGLINKSFSYGGNLLYRSPDPFAKVPPLDSNLSFHKDIKQDLALTIEYNIYIPGDFDNNNVVNLSDCLIPLLISTSNFNTSPSILKFDTDNNSKIDMVDSINCLKKVAQP